MCGCQIHEVSVPLSREFNEIKDSFLSIMKFVLGKLATTRAITETNPEKLNSMMLLKLKDSLKTCVTAARGLAAPMPCLLMVCIVCCITSTPVSCDALCLRYPAQESPSRHDL